MDLTLGFVTDIHYGPDVRFGGKLRKLSHEAPALLAGVVRAMNDEVHPDLLVNLGDDIEDQDHARDLARYGDCQRALRGFRGALVNVAGNHDTINLSDEELSGFWGREGPLYHAFDHGPWRLVVLRTTERKDVDVSVGEAQLRWLREDLAATTRDVVVLMHHSASEQDLTDSRWFHAARHLALARDREDLRAIFEESGKVRVVFNGHVHRNHLDVIRGIPYVTVQSLIENLDDDAPGRPAAAYAVARVGARRVVVRVHGNDPARYQFDW